MSPNDRDLVVHVSRRAMASEFEVCYPAERYPDGTRWGLEALDLVDAVENELSFFRPESAISRINRLAAAGPVPVEPALFELLQLATRLYEETDGAYDITSAPLWEAWGFARRDGKIPCTAELSEARQRVGGRLLKLDAAQKTVQFAQPGMRISVASIGKGHALDVCADRLLMLGMSDFVLHGGRSSVLARGQRTTSEPWQIGVGDPRHVDCRAAVLRVRDKAIGTSSSQFQSFRHGGRRYGHILDPRTGQPADGVLSATVVAPTAAMADALSTAFYVMGPERSLAYCEGRPDIGLIMLCPGPNDGIEVVTAGFAPGELEICRDRPYSAL